MMKLLIALLALTVLAATCGGPQALASSSCPDCEKKTNRARAYVDMGEYDHAEKDLEDVVNTFEGGTIENAPYAVALQNLGLVLYLKGRLDAAESSYKKALPLTELVWGENSLATAENLHSIARTIRRNGRFLDAEPYMKRIVELREKHLGHDHPLVGNAYLDLAVNTERLKKYSEAEPLFKRAIEIREKQTGQTKRLVVALQMYEQLLTHLDNLPLLHSIQNRVTQLRESSEGEQMAETTQKLEIRALPTGAEAPANDTGVSDAHN